MSTLAASDDGLAYTLAREDLPFFAAWCFQFLHPGVTYKHNWHIEAIAYDLALSQAGRAPRLLITMPPRHMKSLMVSVAWAAFLLGHDPSLRIILVSYGQELSGANLRLLRQILESDWYQAIFPAVRLAGATQVELLTDQNGFVRALSTGGVFTGFGGDYIIFDDPMKQSDAASVVERDRVLRFYQGTILTRTNDPRTARIVIVMQRVHDEDLASHAAQSGEYRVLNLPAVAEQVSEHCLYYGGVRRRAPGDLLWEEVFPQAVLDQRQREMGDYEFALQYQQNPIPLGGGMIRVDEIQRHAEAPNRDRCQYVVQSIDTGMSDQPGADFSVIMTFGYYEDAWRLLDVQRHRQRYPDLLDLVRAHRRIWRPDVALIERAASGIPLLQDLARERSTVRRTRYPDWRLQAYAPTCGKIERMAAQSAKLRDGFVTFPMEAPWMPSLLHEISAFPTGRNDDQVDALAQFIDWASGRRDASEWGQRPSGRARPHGRPRRQSMAGPV